MNDELKRYRFKYEPKFQAVKEVLNVKEFIPVEDLAPRMVKENKNYLKITKQ